MKTRYVLLVIAGLIALALLALVWPLAIKSRVEARVEGVQQGAQLANTFQQMKGDVGKSVKRSEEVSAAVAERQTAFKRPTSDPFIELLPVEEPAAPALTMAPGTAPGSAPEPGYPVPGPAVAPGPVPPGTVPPAPIPSGAAPSPATATTRPGTGRPGAPVPVVKEDWPKVRVHGLALSGANPLAVINNDVYGVDNTLNGLKVVSVNEKGVVLVSQLGTQRELLLEGWLQGGKAK